MTASVASCDEIWKFPGTLCISTSPSNWQPSLSFICARAVLRMTFWSRTFYFYLSASETLFRYPYGSRECLCRRPSMFCMCVPVTSTTSRVVMAHGDFGNVISIFNVYYFDTWAKLFWCVWTYIDILFGSIDQHFWGLLVGHELINLIEDESSKKDKESCRHSCSEECWLRKTPWEIFVEIE